MNCIDTLSFKIVEYLFPMNEGLFIFFLPTVLRSILQITLTTAFHQTLQLLLALPRLCQVQYHKSTASECQFMEWFPPYTSCATRWKLTPSKSSKQSISGQIGRGGRDRLPYDGEVIYIQNFSLKLHVFRNTGTWETSFVNFS